MFCHNNPYSILNFLWLLLFVPFLIWWSKYIIWAWNWKSVDTNPPFCADVTDILESLLPPAGNLNLTGSQGCMEFFSSQKNNKSSISLS